MATTTTIKRILDAALELFNERGVGSVSTRAVAERAGVSSGNLHYHFVDKEAIVRALLGRRLALGDGMWVFPEGGPSVQGLRELLRRNLEITWEYRFLSRELVSLAFGDAAFSEFFAARYRDRMHDLRSILSTLVESGQLDLEAGRFEAALTSAWIISEHWLSHLETIGERVDATRFDDGADLILRALGWRSARVAENDDAGLEEHQGGREALRR